MSIRSRNPYAFDISPQLRGVLEQNGLQAHISYDQKGQLQLVTMSHDTQAPKFFPISEDQADLLRDGGTNYTNKKAYQTFVGIVGKDYYVPGSYVAACNAGSPVNMGQYGYRINSGEYGYDPVWHAHHHMEPVPPIATPPFRPFRGPRFGPFDSIMGGIFAFANGGYHIRRINDRPFLYQDRPMVVERPDQRIKPGESKSFDYGFYDKGQHQSSIQTSTQPLKEMDYKVDEIKLERPKGQSISLNDHDYQLPRLTGEKFQKLLASHGLVLDKSTNTLLVQSSAEQVDVRLKVTDAQMKKLLAPKVEYKLHGKEYNKGGVSLNERLAILNNIISKDFSDKVTYKQLESHDYVDLHLKPELEAKLNARHDQAVSHAARMVQDPKIDIRDIRPDYTVGFVDKWNSIAQVHGGMLDNKQGFYLPVKDGRRIAVGEIIAYNYGGDSKENKDGGYRMTAVINNKIVSHEISQEDYMKFVNYDDEHRLKLFDKYFDEVKIKSISNGKFEDAKYFQDYYNKVDDALKKGQDKDFTFGKYIYGFTIKYADNVATLNGHYSLVSDNMHAAITGAMAWYDTASKEYYINVRDDKDRGMWSYKITAEQFQQFKNASDDEKAKMLTTLIPFKDENGKNLKVVRTEQLPQSIVDKSLDNGRYNEKEASNARKVGFGADEGQPLDKQEDKDKKEADKKTDKDAKNLAGKAIGFGAVAMTDKDVVRLANSEAQQVADGRAMSTADLNALRQGVKTTLIGDASVDGEDDSLAKHHKLWKREGEHGRDTTVGSIAVARLRDAQGNVVEGKYKMSAVIDGNVISHEITQKDYNKFLAVNDYQRMKLFDKIFPEVQMKTNPDHKFNFGAAIMSALTVGLDVAAYALSAGRPEPRPDIYLDKNVYYKPGVVSPQAVSSAIFESEMHNHAVDESLGNGRGMGV